MQLVVNGCLRTITEPSGTLLTYLRRNLGLIGTKNGCSQGHCGTCTVLIDGQARRACVSQLPRLDGARIETIENLSRDGQLHPIQQAFITEGAVQCGFCTPGMIMAAKGLLDTTLEPDEAQIKVALKDNLCRCTGYVSIVRAVQLAARWLKNPGDRPDRHTITTSKVVGEAVPRGYAKVTGTALYADDLTRQNMLYGKLVHTEVPHARLISINTWEAEQVPGVVTVLTAQDVPGLNAFGAIMPHQPVLAQDIVRYTGDPVALVLAESDAAAAAAAAKVHVDLEPLQGIFAPAYALQAGAPVLHGDTNLLQRVTVQKGDVAAGLAQADVVVEDTYTVPMVEHAYLEPEAALAEVDAQGRVTVWGGSQSSHDLRHEIARALGYPEDKIRVIATMTGGAFGGKEEPLVQIHAALGAIKTGRPVKLTLSRQESIIKSTKRHGMQIHMQHAASQDGRLLAVRALTVADTGPYASLGQPVVFRAAVVAAGPYAVDNCYSDAQGVYTNNAIGGAFRGFGSTQVAFAGEIQIDRLARKLGLDPIEFRLRNALKPGAITATGQVLEAGAAFPATLLAVREALARTTKPESQGTKRIGVGIASAYKNVGLGNGQADGAWVTLQFTPQGRILIRTGAAETGQGLDTTLAQIAAEAGEFPLCQIDVVAGDTDLALDAGMTTASRQTYVSGNAVKQAAQQLNELLKQRIASHFTVPQGATRFSGTGISVGKRCLPYGEVYQLLVTQGIKPEVSYYYEPPKTYPLKSKVEHTPGMDLAEYRLHFAYCFGTQAAIVEVDTVTGQVRVLKIIAAQEVGRAINPLNVRGQIEGSVIMGLGYALLEEYRLEQGQPVTDTLRKLNLPKSTHVPQIETIIIEEPEPGGPFAAKGLGELPVNPTAPAILNAIYDAVGVRCTSIPVRPQALLQAINGKEV